MKTIRKDTIRNLKKTMQSIVEEVLTGNFRVVELKGSTVNIKTFNNNECTLWYGNDFVNCVTRTEPKGDNYFEFSPEQSKEAWKRLKIKFEYTELDKEIETEKQNQSK